MTNSRKNLKEISVLVLVFSVLSFVRAIVEIILTDFSKFTLPDGAGHDTFLIAKVILCVVGLILLLPQIYIGVKGLKIAKNPTIATAHIVWAIILAVIAVFALVSPISAIIQTGNVTGNLFELFDTAIDVFLFIVYAIYALRVLKGIE